MSMEQLVRIHITSLLLVLFLINEKKNVQKNQQVTKGFKLEEKTREV